MKYCNNKTIKVTFTIRERLYYEFRTCCMVKKMPATVLKEFIKNYVKEEVTEREKSNGD